MTQRSLRVQPSNNLLPARSPIADTGWTREYLKLVAKAKEEGPKKCERCPTNLRVDNRERGVCERCWREAKS